MAVGIRTRPTFSRRSDSRRALDGVVVVEDEGRILGKGVEQVIGQGIDRRRPMSRSAAFSSEEGERPSAYRGMAGPKGTDEVDEEDEGVLVGGRQAVPVAPRACCLCQEGEGRRLPVPGSRSEDGQPVVEDPLEEEGNAGPRHHVLGSPRWRELGFDGKVAVDERNRRSHRMRLFASEPVASCG